MANVPYPYTSAEDMTKLFSRAAVESLSNHDGSEDEDEENIALAINLATDEINLYCSMYEEQGLAASPWIRSQATWLACYYLSQYRGNPEVFAKNRDEILKMLERIKSGEMKIPRLGPRTDSTPALSNFEMDERCYENKIRVQQSTSTGGFDPSQDLDFWGGNGGPRWP